MIPSTTELLNKSHYDTEKLYLERNIGNKKILSITDLVKKTDYDEKITKIQNKIPDTTGLVKKMVLIQKLEK